MLCKVEYGKIVYANSKEYEFTQPFDIICYYDYEYLLLVPSDLFLSKSFIIGDKDCKKFKIHPKFKDGLGYFISDSYVVRVVKELNGMFCSDCGTYAEHSEVNRLDKDGKGVFVCWNCRNYKHYKHHH